MCDICFCVIYAVCVMYVVCKMLCLMYVVSDMRVISVLSMVCDTGMCVAHVQPAPSTMLFLACHRCSSFPISAIFLLKKQQVVSGRECVSGGYELECGNVWVSVQVGGHE